MGSPLWNLRSRRSLNSYTSPSGLSDHDSARLGDILPFPGRGRTRASCRAKSIPNGVIWAGAVDGSNHVGAMVTCHAMTTSPAGVAWPETSWATARLKRAATTSTTMGRDDGVVAQSLLPES